MARSTSETPDNSHTTYTENLLSLQAVSQGMSALTDLLGLGSIFRELPVCATLRRLNNGLPRVQARSKIHQCPIAIHIEG